MGFVRQPLSQDDRKENDTATGSTARAGVEPVECSTGAALKYADLQAESNSSAGDEPLCSDTEEVSNRSRTGPLSCASTDSGPPSPGHLSGHHSLQCSPLMGPADSSLNIATCLGTAAASASSMAVGSDFGRPRLATCGDLPEYRIHKEWEPHPAGAPILRVRGTFVEFWEPPLSSHKARRSQSAPAASFTVVSLGPPVLTLDGAVTQQVPDPSPNVLQPLGYATLPMNTTPKAPPNTPVFDLGASLYTSSDTEGENASASARDGEMPEPPMLWLPPAQMTTVLNLAGELPCTPATGDWFYAAPAPCQWTSSTSVLTWTPVQSFDDMTWMQQQQQQLQGTSFYNVTHESHQDPGHAGVWFPDQNASTDQKVDDEIMDFLRSPQSHDGERPAQWREPRPVLELSGRASLLRKGSSLRKTPSSDEKIALEIISTARAAYNHQRQDSSMWELSHQNKHTSANVQNALDTVAYSLWHSNSEADWHDAWALVAGLQGRVQQAYESPFANFVLSKFFEVMPTAILSGLCEELLCERLIVDAAKHRFGCRCMIRLVRYHARQAADHEEVAQVIKTLLESSEQLSLAQFGTHVVQELIDKGLPEHLRMVSSALKGSLSRYSRNRFACRVVEKLLSKCCASDAHAIMDELLSNKDGARQLVGHEFGSRVLKALLSGEHQKRAAQRLCSLSAEIGGSRSGKLMLQEAHSILVKSRDKTVSR